MTPYHTTIEEFNQAIEKAKKDGAEEYRNKILRYRPRLREDLNNIEMEYAQNEEYQKHYSPDGERIEYLMEHPELSEQPPENKDWEEEFDKKFYEGNNNSIHCRDHDIYVTPLEMKNFIAEQIYKAEQRTEDKWRKIINSGKQMYELGKKDEWKRVKVNISCLRQWLNEDRITDKKMVTNEEIETFLTIIND